MNGVVSDWQGRGASRVLIPSGLAVGCTPLSLTAKSAPRFSR